MPLDAGRGERLRAEFADAFGRPPAGLWAAPGRVNLIGEHTDYNEGFALPLALPRRVYVAAARRDDDVLAVRSLREGSVPARVRIDILAPGVVSGWAAYVVGVAWALGCAGYPPGGAELLVDSDLPTGSGLASSAALECAVAVALTDVWSLHATRDELARIAQRAESDFVGMPCGVMDQMASMRAQQSHAFFLDCRDLCTAHVPLDLDAAGLALLVVDTRAAHRHVDGEYASRRRGCEEAAAALGVTALRDVALADVDAASAQLAGESARYVRHVVRENARVLDTVGLLRNGDPAGVGRLLTASHVSLRDDYRVSCRELDLAVDTALRGGALGARMTGGGFGGCAIALVEAGGAGAVADAIVNAFRESDLRLPEIHTAAPSGGAARLE